MDDLDREILNEIQWTFPLVQRPYDTLAEKFNQSPSVIKERILRLRESGILRQMSAIFDTRRLGYKSSLVAAKYQNSGNIYLILSARLNLVSLLFCGAMYH